MSHRHDPLARRSARREWRRREARRRRYARRRALALLVLIGVLVGLGFGVRWAVIRIRQALAPEPDAPAASAPAAHAPEALPFAPAVVLEAPDLTGDGEAERVAVSAPDSGRIQLALVAGWGREAPLLGQPVTAPEGTVSLMDLPRAQDLLVWRGSLPAAGEPLEVSVGGEIALEARGGEPIFRAWALDPEQGLVPADYYAALAPLTPPEPTVILVDKGLNVLWYYEGGDLVQTARVSTGRHIAGPDPSPDNWEENCLTPAGRFTVTLKVPGMPYFKEGIPALDPANPLGTRWIGFSVFEGDDGSLWAIHGTNAPEALGRWNSDGSILMSNGEVERLYDRVELGTPILITNSLEGT
ncbi:MAG: L,D-transpeptidase [Bacillota bacterium]|nr:MAG: hypothetical protein DIU55_01810 [Bacillota bacterium]